MTFGELMNVLHVDTKISVYNEDSDFLGCYKMNQILHCNDYIVDCVWPVSAKNIAVKIVKG